MTSWYKFYDDTVYKDLSKLAMDKIVRLLRNTSIEDFEFENGSSLCLTLRMILLSCCPALENC